MRRLIPGFLKRIDRYLLLNHPVLWSSRIHYVGFTCILFLLFTVLVGKILILEPSILIHPVSFYIICIIVGLVTFFGWGYYQAMFNYRLNHGKSKWIHELKTTFVFFVVIATILTTIVELPGYFYSNEIRNSVKVDGVPEYYFSNSSNYNPYWGDNWKFDQELDDALEKYDELEVETALLLNEHHTNLQKILVYIAKNEKFLKSLGDKQVEKGHILVLPSSDYRNEDKYLPTWREIQKEKQKILAEIDHSEKILEERKKSSHFLNKGKGAQVLQAFQLDDLELMIDDSRSTQIHFSRIMGIKLNVKNDDTVIVINFSNRGKEFSLKQCSLNYGKIKYITQQRIEIPYELLFYDRSPIEGNYRIYNAPHGWVSGLSELYYITDEKLRKRFDKWTVWELHGIYGSSFGAFRDKSILGWVIGLALILSYYLLFFTYVLKYFGAISLILALLISTALASALSFMVTATHPHYEIFPAVLSVTTMVFISVVYAFSFLTKHTKVRASIFQWIIYLFPGVIALNMIDNPLIAFLIIPVVPLFSFQLYKLYAKPS